MSEQERSELCSNYGGFCKKEWVGLTDEEIETIYAECNVWDKFEYERMLEAKLKDKNNG